MKKTTKGKATTYGFSLTGGIASGIGPTLPWIGTMFFTRYKRKELGVWPGTFLPANNGPIGLSTEMFELVRSTLLKPYIKRAMEIEALEWV